MTDTYQSINMNPILELVDMDVDTEIELPTLVPSLQTSTPTPSIAGPTSTDKDRVFLSQEAHGSITTRTSDDQATALEVDHMILDYLMHQAITTCVANAYHSDTTAVDQALLQVNDFRQLFKTRHPDYIFDDELCFRQLLLQLIVLTTQRFTPHNANPSPPTLLALRARNATRAMAWIETASRIPTADHNLAAFNSVLPLDQATLLVNRTNFLRILKLPVETSATGFYGSSESVSLLDLLPLFMRVSAAACETLFAGNINDQWMHLASKWMLQACLEQYLVYGASGSGVVDEAFAWGYKRGKDPTGEAGSRELDFLANAMFEDSQYAREVEGWRQRKNEELGQLLSHGEVDIRSHLARLAELNPIKQFVGTALQFLDSLSKSIPEPTLLQLEKGKLAGLSEQATRQFLKDCGVGERGLNAML